MTFLALVTRKHAKKPYGVGIGLNDTNMLTIWFATRGEQAGAYEKLDENHA